jgi:hypothetical protein
VAQWMNLRGIKSQTLKASNFSLDVEKCNVC